MRCCWGGVNVRTGTSAHHICSTCWPKNERSCYEDFITSPPKMIVTCTENSATMRVWRRSEKKQQETNGVKGAKNAMYSLLRCSQRSKTCSVTNSLFHPTPLGSMCKISCTNWV